MKKRFLLGLLVSALLMTVPTFAANGEWKRDNTGWCYQFSDGSYAKSSWVEVNNSWYFMDASGYMHTGWLNYGGDWYYLDTNNGDMKVGWIDINNTWYYLNPSNGGRMAVNTYTPDGFYVDGNGVYQSAKNNNAASSSSNGWVSSGSFEDTVIELVNAERTKRGLPAFTVDSLLMNSASERAEELTDKFSHKRPDGSSYTTALPSGLTAWGENVAMGQESPEDVVKSWMKSSGHRANILSKDFTLIGVGYYDDGDSTYWVQDFGARK